VICQGHYAGTFIRYNLCYGSRMIQNSSQQKRNLPWSSWGFLAALVLATCFLGGCAGTGGGNYSTTAYQPSSLSDVQVKVSLNKQMVYVMEGSRCLMATPTCVGKPGYPTPTGNFAVISKDQFKRSSTYGYWVKGGEAHPGEASHSRGPGWTYVGYPMAFWVEFTPGYGFHEGPIWPYPRSHGCLHIHESAVAKLFELVHIGTPVDVAYSQPEDSTFGRDVRRPTDYADPDPPASLMISQEWFEKPRDTQLLPQPTQASGT
jgi:hypothetical protein